MSCGARPRSTRRGAAPKCAFWHRLTVPPETTVEVRLRLRPADAPGSSGVTAADFDEVVSRRRAEAEFCAELTPAGASADEATWILPNKSLTD